MLVGLAFLGFGFLMALAYLAYHQERDLIAYGLGGLGVASALWGVELLIAPDSANALSIIVAILRFVAMGGGLAFLAYTATVEGRRWFLAWRARREAEIQALLQGRGDRDRAPAAR